MASLQTRLARAAAADAQRAWAQHRQLCARCKQIRGRGADPEPCADGRPLAVTLIGALRESRRQAELDRQPVSGQQALW